VHPTQVDPTYVGGRSEVRVTIERFGLIVTPPITIRPSSQPTGSMRTTTTTDSVAQTTSEVRVLPAPLTKSPPDSMRRPALTGSSCLCPQP